MKRTYNNASPAETGRFYVHSTKTGRVYCVEPIEPRQIDSQTQWGWCESRYQKSRRKLRHKIYRRYQARRLYHHQRKWLWRYSFSRQRCEPAVVYRTTRWSAFQKNEWSESLVLRKRSVSRCTLVTKSWNAVHRGLIKKDRSAVYQRYFAWNTKALIAFCLLKIIQVP